MGQTKICLLLQCNRKHIAWPIKYFSQNILKPNLTKCPSHLFPRAFINSWPLLHLVWGSLNVFGISEIGKSVRCNSQGPGHRAPWSASWWRTNIVFQIHFWDIHAFWADRTHTCRQVCLQKGGKLNLNTFI